MKRGIIVLLVVALASISVSAMEPNLTVDANYWFGASKGLFFIFPTNFSHNSANLTANAEFPSGFILGADYTYSQRSKPSVDGEPLTIPTDDVDYSSRQHLFSGTVGYPYQLAPGFKLTASLGWGYYVSLDKIVDRESPEDRYELDITASNPQIALAANYKVTPEFSLSVNIATFLGTKGTGTARGFTGADANNENTSALEVKLFRWQLEGKYLIKPCLEAIAGYRVWNITAKGTGAEDALDFGSTGLFLGVSYSY